MDKYSTLVKEINNWKDWTVVIVTCVPSRVVNDIRVWYDVYVNNCAPYVTHECAMDWIYMVCEHVIWYFVSLSL